jgi:GTP cyclohydrolase I
MEPNDTITRSAVGRQERPLSNYLSIQGAYERSKGMLQYGMEHIEKGEMLYTARADFLAAALHDIPVPYETALRMAKWLQEYAAPQGPVQPDPDEIFGGAFPIDHSTGLVIEKDISVTALCEHHMLPFMGRAAIGYIPKKQVVGLSKMKRLMDALTRYPTMQELITNRAATIMEDYVQPHGVMVVMYDMVHMCLSSRGVKDEHANTTTSAVRGVFAPGNPEAPAARNEFLQLLQV